MQQGQVFQLKRKGRDGESQWAYRYRTGGRDSQRVQRGGFASEHDATAPAPSASARPPPTLHPGRAAAAPARASTVAVLDRPQAFCVER
jgi:hypothetical protein